MQLLQSELARWIRAEQPSATRASAATRGARIRNPPPLRSVALEGEDEGGEGIAFVASLVLYLQLIMYGIAVASGVVEEKSSRVVEVLLATVQPRAILAGKILGIGALGLLQLTLTAVVGLAAASASGAIELDAGDIGTLAVVLVWFLFGYLLWSSLYAMGGVMVSRQEDLQSSTTVLTVLLVVGYLLAFPAIDDPDRGLAVARRSFPLFSPIVMPLRVALERRARSRSPPRSGCCRGHRRARPARSAHLRALGAAHGQADEAARGLARRAGVTWPGPWRSR